MLLNITTRFAAVAGLAALVSLGVLAGGCQGPAVKAPAGPAGAAGGQAAAAPAKSGVQLWAEQCGRCHNLRDPAWHSADGREVALHHMRLRVPLTGEDQRAILAFLRGG